MLKQNFEWDICQMPVNVMDAHYRSFQNDVLPELNRRGIGCIGMKSLGGDGQMIEAGLTPQQACGYALSLPIKLGSVPVETWMPLACRHFHHGLS